MRSDRVVQHDEATPIGPRSARFFILGIRGQDASVHIHEVIEKAAGDVVRCSHDDGRVGSIVGLPIWMFDPAACAPMRVETFPQADIAALQALRALLDAAAIGGVAVGLASSNAPLRAHQASLATRIGERSMQRQTQLATRCAAGAAADRSVRREPQRRIGDRCRSGRILPSGDTSSADRPDNAVDPGACRQDTGWLDDGARS